MFVSINVAILLCGRFCYGTSKFALIVLKGVTRAQESCKWKCASFLSICRAQSFLVQMFLHQRDSIHSYFGGRNLHPVDQYCEVSLVSCFFWVFFCLSYLLSALFVVQVSFMNLNQVFDARNVCRFVVQGSWAYVTPIMCDLLIWSWRVMCVCLPDQVAGLPYGGSCSCSICYCCLCFVLHIYWNQFRSSPLLVMCSLHRCELTTFCSDVCLTCW